jgi:hypothetical protein
MLASRSVSDFRVSWIFEYLHRLDQSILNLKCSKSLGFWSILDFQVRDALFVLKQERWSFLLKTFP